MNSEPIYRNPILISLIVGFIAMGSPSSSAAVETLALNRTLDSGGSATASTAFVAAASVTNTSTLTGDVTVVATFSANPAGGQGGRAGEWRLSAPGQLSTVIRRDMSDASNDYGIMNLVWTFSDLAAAATVTLQHRSTNGLRIGTEDITLVTIPMTTEQAGVVLNHDLDDQGAFAFSSASTGFVPVEKSDGSSLLGRVQVPPVTVPRDIFIAATFSTTKPQVGAEDGVWKLQYNEVGAPPATECQDGIDVGTPIQRSLSGDNDVGAVMLYAIAEDVAAGTYEFRLCTASPSGASLETFSASLLAFSLSFVGNGVGGHFPRIQQTVAQGQGAGGNMQPITGLLDPFTLAAVSDVFLAMSFTAFSATGGEGDYGEFETCIEDSVGGYPFGRDQNGNSQEARRRFSSSDDRGAGGQVGLAIGLGAGDYSARGCASVTGNQITIENPNLAGFVPRSIDDTTVPVTLAWFRAVGSGGADLEWTTATEVGNLGFHVHGIERGLPHRLNRELIPSKAVDSTMPASYRFRASGFKGETFLLEDVDITGRSRFHGPFRIGEDYGKNPEMPRRTPGKRIRKDRVDRSDLASPRRQRGAAPSFRPVRVPSVNVGVDRDGVYRLSYEQLLRAGIDLGGVPVVKLELQNRGKRVPIRIEGGARFGAGSFLEFVGRGLDTLYTRTNVYTLQLQPRARARVNLQPRARARVERDQRHPPIGPPPTSYLETSKVETNRLYDFAAPGKGPWYDTRLLAISEPVEATYALELDSRVEGSGPLQLTVALWGVTDFPQAPDHHVVVEVNGVELADEWFDGLVDQSIDLRVPEWVLEPSGNTLRIRLPHDTGAQYDLVNYDYYRVHYPRRFRAVDGSLEFTAAAALFRVDALPSSKVVVYRTTKQQVELLEGVQITGTPGAYSATFPGSEQPATYYVSSVDSLHIPPVEEALQPVELNGGDAELLILTHPDFLEGLEPLVQARRGDGYSVRVVDIRQVYQRYSHGIFDPEAIRTFLRIARKRLKTDYVLLVGGDTYDYHDYLGTGSMSFVPTLYAQTDRIVRYAPVDPLYGDLDGDRVPDLAIGRLPVRSVDELELLISKTLDYSTRGGLRSLVAAADAFDTMSGTSFAELSESLLSNLSETWEIERAYIDDAGLDTAREVLLDNLDEGVALASYFGHSGPSVWSFLGLFDVNDAEALDNEGRPSIVTQWGCWNAYFVSPSYDTLAHVLLLSGEQGAAAVLGATTLTQTSSEEALGAEFFSAIAIPRVTIGAALRDAKQALAATRPDLADVLLGWTLLGDPTLMLEP